MSLTTRHKYQSENKLAIKDAQYKENSKRTMKRAGVNIYRGNIWFAFNLFPNNVCSIARLKRDGTCAETRFCLSMKRTSPFKSAGSSVQSTTGSRGVHISGSNGSNAGYTMFCGRVQDY